MTHLKMLIMISHRLGVLVGIQGHPEHGNYRVYRYRKVSIEGEPDEYSMRAIFPDNFSTPEEAVEAAYKKIIYFPSEIECWEWDFTYSAWHCGSVYVYRSDDGAHRFTVAERDSPAAFVSPEILDKFKEFCKVNPDLCPPTRGQEEHNE